MKDEVGKLVEPEILSPPSESKHESNSLFDDVKQEIVEKLEKVKDIEEVGNRFSTEIEKFVLQQHP